MSVSAFNDAKAQIRDMLKAAKYPQARIFATQLLKHRSDDAELLYMRGTACAHRSAKQQAERDLRAAIALRPKCIEYYLTLCNLLFSSGRYEQTFTEYLRVRSMAPRHPKVRAFAEVLNGPNGKLNKTLSRLETDYKTSRHNLRISDQLVSLYTVKALFNWHARRQNGTLLFYATMPEQLEHAEYFLNRIRLLPSSTQAGRLKRTRLENLIDVSRRKRFDGFIGDRILSVAIIAVGLSVGGFIDLLYAFSAATAFYAFRRPNYLFNRGRIRHSESLVGRMRALLDLVYGEQIRPSNRIFAGIQSTNYRFIASGTLRALLRGSVMPLSVFAALYKNFGIRHAAAFAVAVPLLAVMLER